MLTKTGLVTDEVYLNADVQAATLQHIVHYSQYKEQGMILGFVEWENVTEPISVTYRSHIMRVVSYTSGRYGSVIAYRVLVR